MWASGLKVVASAGGFDSKVRVKLSGDQVITTASWTTIAWAAADYDTLSEFKATDYGIVVAADGYYDLKFCIQLSNMASGTPCQCRLMVDGAQVAGDSGKNGDATFPYTKYCGGISCYLAAGALVKMDFYHAFGANRSLIATAAGGCRLTMERFA